MANAFTRIFTREASQAAPMESKPAIKGGSFASKAVHVGTAQAALMVPAWYRATDVLASTMAQLVMEYQKLNDEAHGGNYTQDNRADGRTINYLLQVQPNPTMTAAQFWKQITLDRINEGNGIAYVEHNMQGEIEAIWLCSRASLNTQSMTYTISYTTMRGEVSKTNVAPEDILHWRNTFSLDHGLTGVGTLRFAAQALSTAATNDKQARDIAAKGGKYKILLKEEKQPEFGLSLLNKDQREQQKDDLTDALNNGDDVILLSGMMDAQNISMSAAEMSLLDSRKFDNVQISRFTGVPLVLLMDYSNNTYKAPEQAMQAFIQHTIAPMAKDVEAEFNSKLLGRIGYPVHRYHFNEDSLMKLDPKGRAELGKIQLETGVKCVNELRSENDLPAIEGGDRHYISTNLQPLDAPVVGQQKGGNE